MNRILKEFLLGGFVMLFISGIVFGIANSRQREEVVVAGSRNAIEEIKNKITSTQAQGGLTSRRSKKEMPLKVISFITPHHLIADEMMDEIFGKVAKQNLEQKINRIVLVSPNHFNMGDGLVILSDKNWEIEKQGFSKEDFSKVNSDNESIEKLLIDNKSTTNFIYKDNDAFYKEHGISGLIPFVGKYFPGVPIVPMMIKDESPKEYMFDLANRLAELDGNTLLILSSDFSHYLDKNISDFHDREAISVIDNMNYEKVYDLETDCVTGLSLLLKFSELQGYQNFNFINNSNSSEVYNNYFVGDNTSYVTGYFTEGRKQEKNTNINLLFFGDVMLDRHVRFLAGQKGVEHLTGKIERLFWGQDINLINLEGTVTNKESISLDTSTEEYNHFMLTFDPKHTESFLSYNRINLANIGNNHILNFETDGLEQTKRNLAKFHTSYFGDPYDTDNQYTIKEIDNKRIAFVNYNYAAGPSFEKTIEGLKKAKNQSDYVVVYAHWGQEYKLEANKAQENKAHQLIDAGADIIIGSHPHVVQQLEIYKGKLIAYSLGNFIFDQYFSKDVKERLAIGVSITDNKFIFHLIPMMLQKNRSLELMKNEDSKILLERISRTLNLSPNIKDRIKTEGNFWINQ